MRDETPTGDGASTEASGVPSPDNARVLATSSPDIPTEASAKTLKPYCLLGDAPNASSDDTSTGEEPLEYAEDSDVEVERGSFDLRRALKSAVRVLTKERSFTREAEAPSEPMPEAQAGETPPVSEVEPPAEAPEREVQPAGLSGHTSTVAIPEVLGFLAQLRKSGTLWIWNEREQFRIQLFDGNVTFARDETPQRGWLLGEVLISQGALDSDAFEDFLKQPREPGPLGDALINAGLVDKQSVIGAVQFQAQRVFNRAYGLSDATFCFDANRSNADTHGIRISVTHMLFESARARDESEQRLSSVFDDPFSGK